MKYSFDVKISEHIWEDTLGQLICIDAIIAREGFQEYYEDDILSNGSFKVVKVMRPWDEVLKSAPTFEAKPIVIQHPDKNIMNQVQMRFMKQWSSLRYTLLKKTTPSFLMRLICRLLKMLRKC